MKHESPPTYSNKKPSIYNRIRNNHVIQQLLRVFQFLSSGVSLGLFTARFYKIVRTVRRASGSNGAVEGILIGAVIYTLISMLMKFCMKTGGPKFFRLVWIFFDILFVAAFVVVAVLTRPTGNGSSGPCHSYRGVRIAPNSVNCKLPWGTFILAFVSIVLHAITAAFIEGRDHYRDHKRNKHNTHDNDKYNNQGNNNYDNDHNGRDNYDSNHMPNNSYNDNMDNTRRPNNNVSNNNHIPNNNINNNHHNPLNMYNNHNNNDHNATSYNDVVTNNHSNVRKMY